MHKILYVPLDDRPCNYQYPLLLADITEDVELLAPPFSLMGQCKQLANFEKIWEWLFANAAQAEYAILSVDTLVYGNIIGSRTHQRTVEEIDQTLQRFEALKQQFPHLKIEAFNLVARVSAYNSSFEDPDYWQEYGYRIWRLGWLTDQSQRKELSSSEEEEICRLKEEIPSDVFGDFARRREKDLAVNLRCVDFVQKGIFDHLVIPKDDTALYGYAAMDQQALAHHIYESRTAHQIMIYPGADEVGAVLLARIFGFIHQWSPRIYTRYSSVTGSCVVPKYEDRPLSESIKAQITSLGGICVDSALESDFLFAVHCPGTVMEECAEQFQKSPTYRTHVNLHEFFRYIQYYINAYDRPAVLSDVAFANGADIEMMQHAELCGLWERLSAYGGWNTAENTNGLCLAHGAIHTYYAQKGFSENKLMASKQFLVRKIIEDYLFQASLLGELTQKVTQQYPGRSPYYCEGIHDEMAAYAGKRLTEMACEAFSGTFSGKNISLQDFTLPWNRIHELAFSLSLT